MHPASFPWDDLRYLEALERTGKVGAAARELGVAQSTFYRRLSELERATGQLCIRRMATGASLTEFGAALATVGRRTRGGLLDVFGEVRAHETALEGEVSLTTVVALMPLLNAPLAKLAHAHPGLHVTVHLGDDGPSVRRREVDVSLGVMHRPPQGCVGRKLLRLPMAVYGTKEATKGPRRWLVRAMAEVSAPEFEWEREHARDVAVRAPFHALVDLCRAGTGLALLPKLLAAPHRELHEVSEFSTSVAHLERTLWLLTHPDQRKTPRVVALVNALARAFETR